MPFRVATEYEYQHYVRHAKLQRVSAADQPDVAYCVDAKGKVQARDDAYGTFEIWFDPPTAQVCGTCKHAKWKEYYGFSFEKTRTEMRACTFNPLDIPMWRDYHDACSHWQDAVS